MMKLTAISAAVVGIAGGAHWAAGTPKGRKVRETVRPKIDAAGQHALDTSRAAADKMRKRG